jgi:hypothetical protein
MVLVRSTEHRRAPYERPLDRLSQTSKIDKRTGILASTAKRDSRIMAVQFWTFHFFKQLGRRAARTQNHRRGLRHAVQLDPVVLVFWAICPSLALFGGEAGPAPVIPVS